MLGDTCSSSSNQPVDNLAQLNKLAVSEGYNSDDEEESTSNKSSDESHSSSDQQEDYMDLIVDVDDLAQAIGVAGDLQQDSFYSEITD